MRNLFFLLMLAVSASVSAASEHVSAVDFAKVTVALSTENSSTIVAQTSGQFGSVKTLDDVGDTVGCANHASNICERFGIDVSTQQGFAAWVALYSVCVGVTGEPQQ